MSAVEPPDVNTSASSGVQPPAGHARPWRVISQEISHEQDSAKLTRLIAELNQALDEQGIGMSPARMNSHEKAKEDEE